MSGSTLSLAPDPGVAVVWSEDVGRKIIEHHAAGMALYKIANLPGMPSVVTMYEWKQRHAEWATALAGARWARAERLSEEGLTKVDDCDGDSSSQVTKAREQAAYRRWLAGCLDRDTYGDKQQLDVKAQVAIVACFVDSRPHLTGSHDTSRVTLPPVKVRDVCEDESQT